MLSVDPIYELSFVQHPSEWNSLFPTFIFFLSMLIQPWIVPLKSEESFVEKICSLRDFFLDSGQDKYEGLLAGHVKKSFWLASMKVYCKMSIWWPTFREGISIESIKKFLLKYWWRKLSGPGRVSRKPKLEWSSIVKGAFSALEEHCR